MFTRICALMVMGAAAFLVVPGSASANDAQASTLEELGYKTTGEVKRCVWLPRLRNTKVLDDFTILFELSGGKTYANKLSHRCIGLKREDRFGYTLSTSQLCSVDIIEVLPIAGIGGSCGLGEFHEVEKIDPEAEATNSDQ